jgi:uncharacterized membrane protein
MPIAWQLWRQLLSLGTFHLQYKRLVLALGYVFVSLALDIVQRRYQDEVVFLRWPRLVQAAALAAVIFLVIIVSSGTASEPFVYQGF